MRSLKRMTICIVIFIVASACARADVFTPAVQHDDKYFLDGTWKYIEGDDPTYSKVNLDDSKWKSVKVPGTFRKADASSQKITWFRKTFTPPADKNYGWLVFTEILDEGEVWLNGQKLSFPMYREPMEFAQPGLYQKLWKFSWPNPLMIWGAIASGKENVIAVRVTNFPNYRNVRVASHDGPAYYGDSGISSNAYLASHPDIFVRSMERSVKPIAGKSAEIAHDFYIFVENFGRDPASTDISFEIRDRTGKVVFIEQKSLSVSPGGDIAVFSWNTVSDYAKYEAYAELTSKNEKKNLVKLSFHNVRVEAKNGALYVNGSRFIVKGISGTPGLSSDDNLPGSAALDFDLMRKDLKTLSDIGVNALRTEDPFQELMEEAERLGIMVIPVISGDWSRTVMALREFRNILYWELDLSAAKDLSAAREATMTLDTYGRPVAYRMRGKEASSGDFKIVGLDGASTKPCGGAAEYRGDEIRILDDWGVTAKSDNRYMALTSHEALKRSWTECVESGKTEGVIYSELVSGAGYFPTLRRLYLKDADPLLAEILQTIYADYKLSFVNSGGGRKDISITPAYGVEAYDLTLTSDESGKTIGGATGLTEEKSIRASLGQTPFSFGGLTLKYATHGGIEKEFKFNPATPELWAGEGRFNVSVLSLDPGITSMLILNLQGDGVSRQAVIKLEASSPGVSIYPLSRGISIPGNGDVDAPFRVAAGAGAEGWGFITATITYGDAGRLPFKIYLPVEFE